MVAPSLRKHKSILGQRDRRRCGALTGVVALAVARPTFDASDGATVAACDEWPEVEGWHCCRRCSSSDAALSKRGSAGLGTGRGCCLDRANGTAGTRAPTRTRGVYGCLLHHEQALCSNDVVRVLVAFGVLICQFRDEGPVAGLICPNNERCRHGAVECQLLTGLDVALVAVLVRLGN